MRAGPSRSFPRKRAHCRCGSRHSLAIASRNDRLFFAALLSLEPQENLGLLPVFCRTRTLISGWRPPVFSRTVVNLRRSTCSKSSGRARRT